MTPTADLAVWLTPGALLAAIAAMAAFIRSAYADMKAQRDEANGRADRLEARLEERHQFDRDTVLPALATSAEALRQAGETLRQRETRRRGP